MVPAIKGQKGRLETQTGDVWQTANALPYKYACVQDLRANESKSEDIEMPEYRKEGRRGENIVKKGRAEVKALGFFLFEFTWSPR